MSSISTKSPSTSTCSSKRLDDTIDKDTHHHETKLPGKVTLAVDMDSFDGLRGLCALWVVLYHLTLFGSYGDRIDLNGSAAMPLFFMLSGFSLTVVYSSDEQRTASGADSEAENNSKQQQRLWGGRKVLEFYQNRLARIYPVYIILSVLSIGVSFTDFSKVPASTLQPYEWVIWLLLNFGLVQNWVLPYTLFVSLIVPAWFVSVLWFSYIVFPFTINCYKEIFLSSRRRKSVISLIVGVTGHVIGIMFLSTLIIMMTEDFHVATMNILSPGFLMFHTGVLCAFWCKGQTGRVRENDVHISKENGANATVMSQEEKEVHEVKTSQMKWALATDTSTLLYLLLSISFAITFATGANMYGRFFVQIYGIPFIVITVVALVMDGGQSYTAKVCRLRTSRFLGKIGMSLYLVHEPLMRYFSAFIKLVAPSQVVINPSYRPMFGGSMPWWGIFVVLPMSIILAYLLERFVETPCRKLLRAKKKMSSNTQSIVKTTVTDIEEEQKDLEQQ